ncbi:MAG: adenylate cyclase, partial [Fimbriimonadaceae bacterium]|nr:adenylate cyclase [Fimbriimonadaceae bacterium]
MFTDIVGYSALAERDERLALELLTEHQAMMRGLFQTHSGREIKSMADGFLVEFASAVEAVRCALAIQEAMGAKPQTQARIGIHLGDVVVRGDDVLGDGVNVASRIEKIAEPGGICVSEDVVRQVQRRVPATFQSLGLQRLKNLDTPVELFRVVSSTSAPSAVPDRRSIAVLPFTNMSADAENEFFSDGLTEDIIAQLSRISALKVISRTSVMQYKATVKNLRDIGRELGVSTILEGSVRKAGSQVRITAQLIDAKTDEHLWTETYDRELSDIFAVQSDVAQKIAEALRAKITASEQERIRRKPTENMEAYQWYLQGRVHLGKRTEESLRKAIGFFERAIATDPLYALAYTGLADAYIFMSLLEFMPPREAFPKARTAAEKALEIDPSLAEAHASLGLVRFQFDWDWPQAEKELTRAIELNPNYATAHHFFADYLKGMGRFDEALVQIREAQELDPLSLAISSGVGHVLYLSRNYDQAIDAYRHTLELDPKFVQARLWFGRPFLQKGRFEEAISELQQAVDLSGGSTISLAVLAHAHAAAGHRDQA